MKRLLGLIAALAMLQAAAPALADPPMYAKTVSACGTPGSTPVAGNPQPVTADTTGVLCTSSTGGGGGGSASYTAAASPYAVTAGVNKPAGVSTTNSAQWVVPVKPGTTTEVDLSVAPTGAATSALQGAQGTGATYNPPTGGSGEIGYLSGIYAAAISTTPALVAPQAQTTGGCTPYGFTSAASTNSTLISTGAHTICSLNAINTTAAVYYLRVYDGAAAPTCSSATGFLFSLPVPASTTGAGAALPLGPFGLLISSGFGFCLTGGGSSTDNTSAATGVYLIAGYK